MIIGDGFGTRVVEALLTALAEDPRFRDLPVGIVGRHSVLAESFAAALPNLDRIADGAERAIDQLLPYIRVHAFARRLKRMRGDFLSPASAWGAASVYCGAPGTRHQVSGKKPNREVRAGWLIAARRATHCSGR